MRKSRPAPTVSGRGSECNTEEDENGSRYSYSVRVMSYSKSIVFLGVIRTDH